MENSDDGQKKSLCEISLEHHTRLLCGVGQMQMVPHSSHERHAAVGKTGLLIMAVDGDVHEAVAEKRI
jgi:hypothetical protein